MAYPTPSLSWLYITAYTHTWLENEFGGDIKLYGKRVLSISHIPGAREVLRMHTKEDVMLPETVRWSMSAMRMDCLQAGLDIGPKTIEEQCGITAESLRSFVPIECPRMALTANGVLRPWNRMTSFGNSQAFALCKLLRGAFWNAVGEYNAAMAAESGDGYAAVRMIEGFCADTGTPDVFIDDLRREWQRQQATLRKTAR